jgi:ABC-type Fe3+ transport system substrate-binding protein
VHFQKDHNRRVRFLLATGIFFFATCQFATAIAAEIPSRQPQWEATLESAKKEGKVNIYMYRYGKVLDVFRSDHPEIRPYLLTGTGAQITTKILAERRAGRYIADVIGLGSSNYRILHQQAKILDPIQPALMLPEVLDVSRWYGGKHRYLDPDGKFVFAYMANASGGQLYYNTGLVNPKEFNSYYDLFNPKWKGKIVALDPRPRTEIGTTMQFFYYHPELGASFIRQFFGNKDVTFSRDSRQMIDWLGQGKFAICFGCSGALKAKNQGLPIDIFDTTPGRKGRAFQ